MGLDPPSSDGQLQHNQINDNVSSRLDHQVPFLGIAGSIRERVREIIRQVCEEMGVTIINGVLSTDHVHMFVSIPPSSCR